MKVLVTGGAGYVGSVVVSHLIQSGFDVTVLDKCLFGAESLLSFYEPQFHFIYGDVGDHQQLASALEGMDAVVHLAALVGEHACSLDKEVTKAINYDATLQALSIAEKAGVKRFIFISTCSNYGVSSPDILADEDSNLNPLTLYAKTKVMSEQAVLNKKNSMIKTVFRFGTICGLSPRMRFDLLVNDMARSVALDQPIQIFSPDAWRPFLHIQDSARVIEHYLKTPEHQIDGKVFNVVSENYQKKGLMELTLKHFPKSEIEVIEKDVDPRDYRVSAALIEKAIGFKPKYTVEQAFLEIYKAVKGHIFLDPMWSGHSSVQKNVESLKIPALNR